MKRAPLIVYAILALTFCLIVAEESYITVKFDRFRNRTAIVGGHDKFMFLLLADSQPRLSIELSFKGRVPSSTPPSITLYLFQVVKEKKYKEVWKVYFLADGEPVKAGGIVRRNGELKDGESLDMIAFNKFEFADFLKLANAKEVEFKIVNDEFKASAIEMMMLKQVRDEYMKLKKQKK